MLLQHKHVALDDAPRVPPWNAAGMPIPPSRSESKTAQAGTWAAVKQRPVLIPTVLEVKCVSSGSRLESPPTCLHIADQSLLEISNLQISGIATQSLAISNLQISGNTTRHEKSTMYATHLSGLTHLQASGLQTSDLIAAEYSLLQESSDWINKAPEILDRPNSFHGNGQQFDSILENGTETIMEQSAIDRPVPPPRTCKASCNTSISTEMPSGIDHAVVMSGGLTVIALCSGACS